MKDAIEQLRAYRDRLKAKGKLLQAHTVHNAIQMLQKWEREKCSSQTKNSLS